MFTNDSTTVQACRFFIFLIIWWKKNKKIAHKKNLSMSCISWVVWKVFIKNPFFILVKIKIKKKSANADSRPSDKGGPLVKLLFYLGNDLY